MTKETMDQVLRQPQGTPGLHKLLGCTGVTRDAQGRFAVELAITPMLLNPAQVAHGGTIFSLCDIAAGSYLMSKGMWSVTVSSTIEYYRPAKTGDVLTASVEERKRGKRLSTLAVEVYAQDGRHIADMLTTVYRQDEDAAEGKKAQG